MDSITLYSAAPYHTWRRPRRCRYELCGRNVCRRAAVYGGITRERRCDELMAGLSRARLARAHRRCGVLIVRRRLEQALLMVDRSPHVGVDCGAEVGHGDERIIF